MLKVRAGIQAEMDLLPPHVAKFIEAHRSAIYPHKLLEPGWGGQLAVEEAEYIAWHLAQDAKLRRLWHIRKRKRYPLQLIAERALPQDPAAGRRIIENALAVRSALGRHKKAPISLKTVVSQS